LPGEPDAVFFSQQMKWIAEFCNVLPLPDAVAMLAHNSLPARAACITFDDGYANNLEIALPILRMQGLPATVFVAVDAVERGIMWNDLVIEALRRAGSEIDLTHLGLGILKITTDTERAQAVTKTLGSLKYLPAQERWTRANELWQRWGSGSFPRLMMTTEQVRALSRAGIDVGGHTVNHPILAKLGDDEAQSEISSCRDWVAATTGRAPLSFAYPNGRPGLDYLPQHAAMVEKAGFALAATTCWGCATSRAHAFELPRISPWDRSRNRFFARLAQIYLQSYQKQTHHTAIEY
jgi:peptidoglycan/xylan/chitin deacetylase (PgdA/CDA1 family)